MSDRNNRFLLLVIALGELFLLTFRLPELFPFIGDQGWFYLSAGDMIVTGNIPLVGITTSHIWLHHGAIFTYLLAFALWICSFHPLSAVIVTIPITIAATLLLYKLGKIMFNRSVGLIAAILFATSPLVLIHTRMAYHTSPLAFCSVLFIFSVFKWISGDKRFLPLATLSLALLYNFEISTFVFFIIFALTVVYGIIKKRSYALKLNRKIIGLSLISFIVPMAPMLIYDTSHGFPQTLKFAAWVIYKVFKSIFGGGSAVNLAEMISFFAINYQKLIFIANGFIAFIIFSITFFWLLNKILFLYKNEELNASWILLALWIIVPLIGELINHTTTEAHLLVIYAPILFVTSLFISSIKSKSKILAWGLVAIIITSNVFFMVRNDYLLGKNGGYGPAFTSRLDAAKQIVAQAGGKRYNLKGEGAGSQFESFTMNYEYLTWWLGNSPSKLKQKFVFTINETENDVIIKKL